MYRRITCQCAKDDWPQCSTHAAVLNRHGSTDILTQFLRQKPETWYIGAAPRERRRDVKSKQQAPSARVIGSFKTEGQRAWVWHDDGSVYDVPGDFPGFDLHWMIAYGNRRKGHRSDLQEKRRALLEDPHDTWRPTDADYGDLLAEHDNGFTARAVASVQSAVGRAEREHNTVIAIESTDVEGSVVHEHDHDDEDDGVEGVVVAEINELWLLLSKQRKGGRQLTYQDALVIAAAAYPDGVFPDTVQESYSIRDGLLTADPTTHYVFYAELHAER